MLASSGRVSVESLVGSAQKTESTISRRRGLLARMVWIAGSMTSFQVVSSWPLGSFDQLERDRVRATLVAGGNLRPQPQ